MSHMINMQPEWSEAHTVLEMADLVRREGNRVYSSAGMAEGCYHSMLCGLTVSFQRGGTVRAIKAHDLEMDVQLVETQIANNDGIERNSAVKMCVMVTYKKGTPAILAAWHRHLCAFRQSIRSGSRETVVA
ncbi:MAG: hypothetical protein KGQ41_02445 [Alphaproteobacteria bacterium]|nr:hypothetical protein [Alphaproteobacteria bacterium]